MTEQMQLDGSLNTGKVILVKRITTRCIATKVRARDLLILREGIFGKVLNCGLRQGLFLLDINYAKQHWRMLQESGIRW